MNKLKDYFTIFLFFIIYFLLFKYNHLLSKSVLMAFNLWLRKVFPSLFIMFIISDIIINSNLFNSLKIFNKPFNKIFNTSNNSFISFILSIVSGTPTSAFIIKEMLNHNQIDLVSANKLISYTFFSNPLFLYNILLLSFNKYQTIKIILIHYFTNIIIGLLIRKKKPSIINYNNDTKKQNIIMIIPHSIKKSLDTMFLILGTITFYMIITNILISIIPFNQLGIIICKGILEITQSLNILNTLIINSKIKEIIAISLISFGGLSIHTQVYTLISDSNISYFNFLKGRIYHTLISTITYLLFP